ncbi:hypothetical protein HAZT_HAZT005615 [Hyalella azteca]|uniref:Uncharacterized protein n=1 Tax=Hyalella azteca TaxID=294128 RepID=A0A6A0H0X5_HYAAZ|nr:hypothetical protein HAZT_HAZT005615 [Hyalella azteca]
MLFSCHMNSSLSLLRLLICHCHFPRHNLNLPHQRHALLTSSGTSFLVWDVGGQEKLRPLWRSYTRATDGIVFVVDSADVERFDEAKMELARTMRTPEHTSVPVLVLANKQDLPGAKDVAYVQLFAFYSYQRYIKMLNVFFCTDRISLPIISMLFLRALTMQSTVSVMQVEKALGLTDRGAVAQCHVQPACAIIGEGLEEGLDILYEMICKKKKISKLGGRIKKK